MKNLGELLWESAKEIGAKAVTFAATAFLANDGFSVAYKYAFGASPDSTAMQLLVVACAYKVWTGAVVPVVENFFQQAQTATGARKATAASPTKSRFELV